MQTNQQKHAVSVGEQVTYRPATNV